MCEKTVKRMVDIGKLCKAENFILTNGRIITEQDKDILNMLEDVMSDYSYGWYICEDNIFIQLKEINQFKIYILGLEDKDNGNKEF